MQSPNLESSKSAWHMDNTTEYQPILAPDRNQGGNKVDEHPEKRPLSHFFYCFLYPIVHLRKKIPFV